MVIFEAGRCSRHRVRVVFAQCCRTQEIADADGDGSVVLAKELHGFVLISDLVNEARAISIPASDELHVSISVRASICEDRKGIIVVLSQRFM